MFGLLDGIKIGAGVAIGAALALAYALLFSLPAAREDGASRERVVWQKREADAKDQRERERQATQKTIDAIETEYHQRDQARRADVAEIERALQDEQNDAAPIPTPSPGGPCSCRPAVSRKLRDELQRLGRTTPRNDTAIPDRSVRGGVGHSGP